MLNYEPRGQSVRQPRYWAFAVAVLVPTFLQGIYAVLSRWPTPEFSAVSDWSAIAIADLIGVSALAISGLEPRLLLVLIAFYLPVEAMWLLVFTLEFLCRVFGTCM